ncbi:hypothetical protein LRX75_10745 [Rhizobium sp. DKSPLA3]|uniref:Uncharacterized protein n=1 Tax=Rhizobium quercicola TaxID=2901226 RepID=A0A9X1NSC5_9HYPH|nr:hypothetical protein [Rhizobium quercicola]MCD7109523.1 hypothetical protein [Rhizobium quercicola]
MGTLVAVLFLLLLLFGCLRSPGGATILAGLLIFVAGLVPLALITGIHPYVFLAVLQTLTTTPAVPIGIALMALGRLLVLAERRASARRPDRL